MKWNIRFGIAAILLSALACEPVFAIGWEELLLFLILFLVLLGPPMYRFIRALERFLKRRKEE